VQREQPPVGLQAQPRLRVIVIARGGGPVGGRLVAVAAVGELRVEQQQLVRLAQRSQSAGDLRLVIGAAHFRDELLGDERVQQLAPILLAEELNGRQHGGGARVGEQLAAGRLE
jgi:hypothetical protein